MTINRTVLIALTVFWATSSLAATLTAGGTTLTAKDMTPNGDVLIYGFALEHRLYESRSVRTLTVVTADGSGTVSYSPLPRLEQRSLWFVIDLTTGALAKAAPGGSPATFKDLTTDVAEGPSSTRFTRNFATYLDGVLVRPGKGIWTLTAGDGGPNDDDGRPDGAISMSFSRFATVPTKGKAAPPPPATLTPGDVFVAVDPATLHAYIAVRSH